jgi:hypothetical protein
VVRRGGLGRGQIKDNGRVAEWLGRGLQNLVQQFKSARDLKRDSEMNPFFYLPLQNLVPPRRIKSARDLKRDSEMDPFFYFLFLLIPHPSPGCKYPTPYSNSCREKGSKQLVASTLPSPNENFKS